MNILDGGRPPNRYMVSNMHLAVRLLWIMGSSYSSGQDDQKELESRTLPFYCLLGNLHTKQTDDKNTITKDKEYLQ